MLVGKCRKHPYQLEGLCRRCGGPIQQTDVDLSYGEAAPVGIGRIGSRYSMFAPKVPYPQIVSRH